LEKKKRGTLGLVFRSRPLTSRRKEDSMEERRGPKKNHVQARGSKRKKGGGSLHSVFWVRLYRTDQERPGSGFNLAVEKERDKQKGGGKERRCQSKTVLKKQKSAVQRNFQGRETNNHRGPQSADTRPRKNAATRCQKMKY